MRHPRTRSFLRPDGSTPTPWSSSFAAGDDDSGRSSRPGIDALVLDALTREESLELLERSGLPENAPRVAPSRDGHNPLALIELPAALSEKQRLGEEPLPAPLPATKAIEEAYARRIEALSEPARAAGVVAAAEPSRPLSDRPRVRGNRRRRREARRSRGRRLVAITEASVRFHHPLVSAAAYAARGPTTAARARSARRGRRRT
jgi:hypothetical protein